MLTLIAENWLWFLIAFLIGVATAWWVWAHYALDSDVDAEPAAPKVAAPEPIAAATLMADPKPKAKVSARKKAPAKKKVAAKPKAKAVPAKKAAAKPKAKAATAKKAAAKPKAKAAPTKKAATKKAVTKKVVAKKPVAKKAAVKKPTAKKAPTKKVPAKKKAAPKIPDNLELLKGVGPKLNTLLGTLGVTSFDQVANWTAADIRDVDSNLGAFAGRISRDNWVDQAKLLSKGDVKAFEKKYGSLGSEI